MVMKWGMGWDGDGMGRGGGGIVRQPYQTVVVLGAVVGIVTRDWLSQLYVVPIYEQGTSTAGSKHVLLLVT